MKSSFIRIILSFFIALGCFVFFAGFFYACISFVLWEFSPARWNEDSRFGMTFVGFGVNLLISLMIGINIFKNMKIYEK